MIQLDDPRLTAYALNELTEEERRAFEIELAGDEAAQREVGEIAAAAALLAGEIATRAPAELRPEQRTLLEQIGEGQKAPPAAPKAEVVPLRRRRAAGYVAAAATLAVAAGALLFVSQAHRGGSDAASRSEEDAPSLVADGRSKQPTFRYGVAASTAAPAQATAAAKADVFAQDLPQVGPIKNPNALPENPFVETAREPKSTFSVDVDTASYSMVRRMLESNQKPDVGIVRIEEMINSFSYSYPQPDDAAFSVSADTAAAPWAAGHQIVRIGLQGKTIDMSKRPACNLVFLVDVSGSMGGEDRIELAKKGLELLVAQLDERDTVSIVTYAGSSGVYLAPTRGDHKAELTASIRALSTGGSTNGASGIKTAYETAKQNFVTGGSNRVVLMTDGDFNVGVTSQNELVELIQEQAKTGVFLSVLGFGTGNFRDQTMEKLADKGNGNYAYIDKVEEARKVLVEQAAGTLITIAKDVKIQVTFDPRAVQSFRLLGYENRVMAHQDFTDDSKDAGDIGAGHRVTALYEIVPKQPGAGTHLADIALRFKDPDGTTSRQVDASVSDSGKSFAEASTDFRFATAVAGFGMLLRGSPHKGTLTWEDVSAIARGAVGDDPDQRRAELVRLVAQAERLSK